MHGCARGLQSLTTKLHPLLHKSSQFHSPNSSITHKNLFTPPSRPLWWVLCTMRSCLWQQDDPHGLFILFNTKATFKYCKKNKQVKKRDKIRRRMEGFQHFNINLFPFSKHPVLKPTLLFLLFFIFIFSFTPAGTPNLILKLSNKSCHMEVSVPVYDCSQALAF